jgi:hypothetical protein
VIYFYKADNVSLEGAKIKINPGKIAYNPNGEHIAAVEVFMLRNLGYQSDELDAAAKIIRDRDGENPFFEYLAHGRSAHMLELIVKKCPSKDTPLRPSVRRFQWFTERGEDLQGDTKQTAWAQSMYWDCLFLSDLYERDVDSALTKKKAGSDPLSVLGNALADIAKLQAKLEGAVAKVDGKIAEIDGKIKKAIPLVGHYCARNYCPPLIPPINPVGEYCKHNRVSKSYTCRSKRPKNGWMLRA